MANLRNYGVGTGFTSEGVTGEKSTFSLDETIYAVHVWENLSGGEVFKIEFQRLEAGTYVTKNTQTWTNPNYEAAYQYANFWNWPAGKYRCRFLLNNIFGGGRNFEITSEAPPTPPTPPTKDFDPSLPYNYMEAEQRVWQYFEDDKKWYVYHHGKPEISDLNVTASQWEALTKPTYPKDITRGIYSFTANNADEEKQFKEFLGIEPAGDDLDTWLSKRDLAGLEQWKSYWTDIFTGLGRLDMLSFIDGKFLEYKEKLVVPPPEITWWDLLKKLLVASPFIGFLTDENLFKAGYKLLTGRDMTDAEYELQKLKLADWVLPINVLLKLFTGRNLKGEAEEFGSATDWIETSIYLAAAIFPGPVDDVAARAGLKGVTKANAAKITATMGEKRTVDALIRTVKAKPETSAKFLSKFPVAVRNAVINGLGRTAYGREAIYILGKQGYFKYTAPGLAGFLAKVGAGPKWFAGIVGVLAGYITFANFLAWSGKEALVETLSFPIWKLIDEKDWEGVLKHIGALRASIKLANDAMILTKPIPLVADIWKGFIDNANIQADIYEDLARKGLEEEKKTGVLTVFSNIENSDVYLDGIKVGVTPFERELEVGTYHILVTKFGYTSQEVDVDIVEGATPKFNAQIEPLAPPPTGKGTLDIAVEPADAVLTVAGHPEITKMGAYELDIGSYSIEASKEGYYPKSITGIVKEAEITDVSIALIALPPEEATINLTSEPEGAKIYIDDKYIFETTPETFKVEPGHRKMTLKLDDYKEFSHEFDIAADETQDHHHILTLIIPPEIPPEVPPEIPPEVPPEIPPEVPPIIPPEVPKKATITITSDPTNADVYIDGDYTWTTTPYTVLLEAGSYWVRVQNDGYYPLEVNVEVEEGEVSELPFVLEEIPPPEIPVEPYIPQTPYYPTYRPPVPYVPAVVTTPTVEVPPYTYDLLYEPVFDIPGIEPISRPTERELLINIETTDVKPWKGRIYSIALLDLTTPEIEPIILIDDNEENLIREFLDIFESISPSKLVGFKLIFDYRYIFSKMLLYRITNKKFYNVALRDVKQILDQVKEEFVYYPDKTGTLNDWGKMLLGRGKYGSQELMLRKYISGDFEYVKDFQLRQIELTRDLYNLARFTMGEAFISSPSPAASPISTPETPGIPETPVSTQQRQCPTCFSFLDKTTGKCPICSPAI